MSDMNLGIFTAKLSESKSIFLTAEHCMIGGKSYGKLPMGPFLDALLQASIPPKSVGIIPRPPESFPFAPQPMPMTVRRLFDAINSVLTDDMIIVADVGDSLFAAMDLVIRSHTEFISPAYYASIGFAIPASIGVGMIRPQLRPIVIVGDGAFQMTGNELSTAIRYRLAPIVIVLNNGGYGTERPILDGKFNDIFNWNYSRIPLLFGSGVGSKINTEPDLMTALHRALSDPTQLHLLEIIIDRDDRSEALSRLTAGLAQRV